MPYKTEKLKLDSPFYDRRTKILPCQKLLIPSLWESNMSIRAIAKRYKVDKRVIQFILFPERHEKNLRDREERGGSKQYYNREENNEAQREHRAYKHSKLKHLIK